MPIAAASCDFKLEGQSVAIDKAHVHNINLGIVWWGKRRFELSVGWWVAVAVVIAPGLVNDAVLSWSTALSNGAVVSSCVAAHLWPKASGR